jgi:hyperosmotically inducible periplasmic protein
MENAVTRKPSHILLMPAFRLASATALALTLAACGQSNDEATLGQKLDSAISQTEQKADEMANRAEGAMDEAQVKAEQAAADARTATSDAADTMGAKIDDAAITVAANAALAGDPDLSAFKINVDTVQGKVTLTGTAPSEAARARAAELIAAVNGVVGIDNQLLVNPS